MEKNRLEFVGHHINDDILVGSHGNQTIRIKGTFDLSGIIYTPRYSVTITIEGNGVVSFRGVCNRMIIKRMSGNCHLDLSQLSCRELICTSLRKKARVTAGKVRSVSRTSLTDDATLTLLEKPVILSGSVSGNARIITDTVTL